MCGRGVATTGVTLPRVESFHFKGGGGITPLAPCSSAMNFPSTQMPFPPPRSRSCCALAVSATSQPTLCGAARCRPALGWCRLFSTSVAPFDGRWMEICAR